MLDRFGVLHHFKVAARGSGCNRQYKLFEPNGGVGKPFMEKFKLEVSSPVLIFGNKAGRLSIDCDTAEFPAYAAVKAAFAVPLAATLAGAAAAGAPTSGRRRIGGLGRKPVPGPEKESAGPETDTLVQVTRPVGPLTAAAAAAAGGSEGTAWGVQERDSVRPGQVGAGQAVGPRGRSKPKDAVIAPAAAAAAAGRGGNGQGGQGRKPVPQPLRATAEPAVFARMPAKPRTTGAAAGVGGGRTAGGGQGSEPAPRSARALAEQALQESGAGPGPVIGGGGGSRSAGVAARRCEVGKRYGPMLFVG